MTLIRANEYDDPADDTPTERAARHALTRYERAVKAARSVAALDAAHDQLDADLAAANTITPDTTPDTITTPRKAAP